ncbi:hypothetical protein [Sporomusa malonica]|uniref:Uncharacterized protein n=2 Tax=Sporomusa malonica TaxID=112901 RepID=A0A1W1Z9Y2_9FIRM|nr:hypothetical protein SAMN04488500_103120 [Sporomusa malonica]
MNNRFDGVYSSLQEILKNTVGRQVKVFDNLQENDDTRILEQFELNKNDNSRSLQVALRFNDSSSRTFNRVVAVTIDWGYLQKRTKPLIWLYEDKKQGYFYKILFDVKH